MDQELDLGNILCGFQLRVFSSALYELMFYKPVYMFLELFFNLFFYKCNLTGPVFFISRTFDL